MPYLFQTVTFSFLFLHLLTALLCELVPLPVETRKEEFLVAVVLLEWRYVRNLVFGYELMVWKDKEFLTKGIIGMLRFEIFRR